MGGGTSGRGGLDSEEPQVTLWALLLFHVTAGGIVLDSVSPMVSQKQCETYMEALITDGIDPHNLKCVDLSNAKDMFRG